MSFEDLSSGEPLAIGPDAEGKPPETARGAFASLGLSPAIEQRLRQLGLTEPTRVQILDAARLFELAELIED